MALEYELPANLEPDERQADLHVCGQAGCGCELVQLLDWEYIESATEDTQDKWRVVTHCPECDWVGEGVYGDEVVEAYDEVLDRGTEAVRRDYLRLAKLTMEEDANRLITALRAGAVFPGDISGTWD